MLSAARIFSRNVPPSIASTSSRSPANSRSIWKPSTLNPLQWFQEKGQAKLRRNPDPKTSEELLEQVEREGGGSIFDRMAPPSEKYIAVAKQNAQKEIMKDMTGQLTKTSDEKGKSVLKRFDHHKYSTANFKISPRKLNLLARQIARKPIDYAILQMNFSEKRASTRVKNMLATARDHAVRYKSLDKSKLIVAEAWVTKGQYFKRVDIKGRGRMGVIHHKQSRIHVVLKEGKTYEERVADEHARKLKNIRSAGLVREDRPLRNVAPIWAW